MTKRLILATLACIYLILGVGCGQSGPLYIPGNPSRVEIPPPAEGAEQQDKDDEVKE